MRTEAVLALQVGVGIAYSRGLGSVGERGGLALGLGLGTLVAEVVLAAMLFRNTVLSSLVLPAQLTSRAPQSRLCGGIMRAALQRMNGGEEYEPWAEAEAMKESFLAAVGASFEELTLSAVDGTAISAAVWHNPRAAAPERWVVFSCPNGQQWEMIVFALAHFATALGAHFVAFNYRGVGASGGAARRADDLVLDLQAVLDWLAHARGALPSQILLHGHSLGGGVALQVCRRRCEAGLPPIAVLHDRSFSSIGAVVRRHPFVQRSCGTPAPAALCAIFGVGCGLLALLLWPRRVGRPHLVLRLAAGAGLGHLVGDAVPTALKLLGLTDEGPVLPFASVSAGGWAPGERSVHAAGVGAAWLSVTTALGMGLPAQYIGAVEWIVATGVLGAAVGTHTDLLERAAPHIVKQLGWELDSVECWRVLSAHATAGGSESAGQQREMMSIEAAVDQGLSTDSFDLAPNVAANDRRKVDPAVFEMQRIMARDSVDFDTARVLYNKQKMREAGICPETGLPLDPKALTSLDQSSVGREKQEPGLGGVEGAAAAAQSEGAGPSSAVTPSSGGAARLPVALVFHRGDGMIPVAASLCAALKVDKTLAAPAATFELKQRGSEVNAHMYPLHTDEEEWAQVLACARRLLTASGT